MTEKEYTTGGENPGPLALTTCTGCGEPRRYYGARKGTHCQNCGKPWAEAEAAALFPVQQPGVTAATNGVPFSKPPRIAPDECVVKVALLRSIGVALALGIEQAHRNGGSAAYTEGVLRNLDEVLAAASGDDGGTP